MCLAGGYGVKLILPDDDNTKPMDKCEHSLVKTEEKEPTCEEPGNKEYWTCSKCNKIFEDPEGTKETTKEKVTIAAKGHTVVKDDRIDPKGTTPGKTEGTHCSECHKVIVPQEDIPPLDVITHDIVYNITNNDEYLKSIQIDNPNPNYYEEEKGMKLKNLKVPGYVFDGWYDGEGKSGELVKEIPANSKDNIELYAKWSKVEYTVQFDTTLSDKKVHIDSMKYTVDKGILLPKPAWYGYTFMGWTDDEDNIVDNIKKGTIGDITLKAHWLSHRNQTRRKKIDKPIIQEDPEKGIYLFAYDIGTIENVPLYEIKDFGNKSGLDISETVTCSNSIGSENAQSIATKIATTTTRTDTWTLSRDWNDSLTEIKSHTDETGNEVVDSMRKVEDNEKISVTGATNGSTNTNTNTTVDENNLSAKISSELKAETPGISGSLKAELQVEENHQEEKEKSKTKSWEKNKSKENSKKLSVDQQTSSKLSKKVSDTYGYNKTHSEGGSEGYTNSKSTATSEGEEFMSSLSYSTEKIETTTKTYSDANAPEGYYRIVKAGTIHVFAVVGYDIAESSYFTYSFGVQDDKTYDFVDYSIEDPNYGDNEDGVLPFEIPYFVNEYIDGIIGASDGLEVDKSTGKITKYDGESKNVVIPRYMSLNNTSDKNDVVRITGITSAAFAGRTDLESVTLPDTVTEIPDKAFAGCTALESVTGGKIEKIGEGAFKDCNKLKDYEIKATVTSVGKNAFKNVSKIKANVANEKVFDSLIVSGAKNIELYLGTMDTILKNKVIVIPDTAESVQLDGGGNTFQNVCIDSRAKETILGHMNLQGDTHYPIKTSSEKVTYDTVSASAKNLVWVSEYENAEITLNGAVDIQSVGINAVLCKGLNLKKYESAAASRLTLTGNMMTTGAVTENGYLKFISGKVITIDSDDYEKLMQDSLEWVLESEMPEGATVVGEKWTYDYTTKITSSKKDVEGYTLYDTTWVWGPYGNWSAWTWDYIASSDYRKVEQSYLNKTAGQMEYNYTRYLSADGRTSGPSNGTWGGKRCATYQERGWGAQLPCVGSQISNQVGQFYLYGSAPCWYYEQVREKVTYEPVYRYADRSKQYTYYLKKVENKESSNKVEPSDVISNVQRWVQYVVK